MSKLFILVEEYDPGFDYSAGEVVSLTPWASYDLGRAGLKYTLLEDYYDVKECISGQDEYLMEQLNWTKQVDEFLKKQMPFCAEERISPVMAHFSRFKYLVDTIVIRSYMLREFLKKARPKKVFYLCKKGADQDYSIYSFRYRALRILKDIAVTACNQMGGVPISIHQKPSAERKESAGLDSKQILRKYLPAGYLKSLLNLKGYEKFNKFLESSTEFKDMNILVLDAGNKPIDFIIKASIAKGSKVFSKNEKGVFLISDFIEKKVFDYKTTREQKFDNTIREDCKKALEGLFHGSNLLNWINEKSGLCVTEIIKPYMEHFFQKICPQFLIEVKNLKEFYKREKIDFIIARASAGENCASALAAANSMDRVKTVCFQHSCSVLDLKDWSIDDLHPFDYYFATDDLSEAYFKFCAQYPYMNKCTVLQAPHYLKDIIGRRRKTRKTRRKQTVVYVTKKLTGGMLRFNTFVYPITWYFEFQKRIVELFGQRGDFNFLFKHSLPQKWAERSVLPYVRNRGFDNVFIVDKPFVEYLNQADRVIMDYPATGFFETAAAGIPLMAFYWDIFKEWKPSVEHFGKCLQKFSTTEEAIDRINTFLDDDPREYVVAPTYSERGTLETLLKIKEGKLEEVLQ